ncbi:Arm DNA-binding domain-containing protein [Paraburkholderia bryophila]|uniref:Arm DNA-binding domain-containing protein n=1 Tax=Paraburkholderia bryophila TaxID=420952 RepID=UPI0015CB8A0F
MRQGFATRCFTIPREIWGRRKELTIGNYPDMTLAIARKATHAQLVSVDDGIDPAA